MRGFFRLLLRLVLLVVVLAVVVPPLSVLFYKFVPPPLTILMIQRSIEGRGMDYQWRPLSEMSPVLPEAAVAAEDAHFCSHHGFDFQAIQAAMKADKAHPDRLRGGSTISQQTAKNVFLWPGRDYVRKAIEAWYTVLIETIWGKTRIMEMYLNVVEFGPGIYGAEAASQHFFHKHAAQLSSAEAAGLIAVLPKPLGWDVSDPTRYLRSRDRKIGRAMGTVRNAGLSDCVKR